MLWYWCSVSADVLHTGVTAPALLNQQPSAESWKHDRDVMWGAELNFLSPRKRCHKGLAEVQTENGENALKCWAGTRMGRVTADAAPRDPLPRTRDRVSSRWLLSEGHPGWFGLSVEQAVPSWLPSEIPSPSTLCGLLPAWPDGDVLLQPRRYSTAAHY